jgi:hypothetical protein
VSQPYNPRAVVEKTPNVLLHRLLSPYKAFADLDWKALAENDAGPILQRLSALDEADRHHIGVRWRQVHALADSMGTAVLTQAGRACKFDIADKLAAMKNAYERAFWCLVEHPQLFDHQRVYAYTYGLPRTSRETRVGFPDGKVDVTEAFIDNLKLHIKDVYKEEERAHLCRVDHREHDGVHVFHAYPSDYVDEIDTYGSDGQLTSVRVTPPFHIVYYLDGPAGSVSLLAKGGADKHDELFKRFSLAAFGAPPPPRAAKKTYDLHVLKDHKHEFRRKPADHIALVRVIALRLQFHEKSQHRSLFEVDPDDLDDSIYDLLRAKLVGGLRELAKSKILSAVLQVVFRAPGQPEKVINFRISVSRWCDLDDGPEDKILWRYLPAWGLEVGRAHVE